MSIQIIWKSKRSQAILQSALNTEAPFSSSTIEDGLELHSDLGGATDHVILISKRQLLVAVTVIASILIIIALGFYQLGSKTGSQANSKANTQSKNGASPLAAESGQQDQPTTKSSFFASYESLTNRSASPSLQELQYQIAKMKGTIEEMNTLKDRYASLAMPGPIRNALEKTNRYANHQASSTSYSNNSIGNTVSTPGLATMPDKNLSATVKEVALMNERLQRTEERWLQELNLLNQMPTGFPIENKAGLSSNYGSRIDPFTNRLSYHSGVDFSAPVGTTIYASGDGKVIQADFDRGNGQYLVIEHAEGFTSKYAHISRFLTRQGEQVKRGQAIAQVGSTGRSTSPHLHYEIAYKGTPINPMEALSQKPTQAVASDHENINTIQTTNKNKKM